MADITNFKTQWLGRRIDFDKVYDFQCVDLVRQYFYEEYGIGNGAGGVPSAISYWTNTPAGVLEKFDRVEGSSARNGDVVMLTGLAGNPHGHIGIATGSINDTKVEILEQNGSTGNGSGLGPDAIRTRWVDRSRVAGLLRPKAPAPTPQQNQATGMPYTVERIEDRKIVLNKYPTNEWDLSKTLWPQFNENPIAHAGGEVLIVRAIAHHNLGGAYYMQNADVARGFNMVDTSPFVEPQPEPTPENYATHYTYARLETPLELETALDANKWDLNFDDYKNARTKEILPKGTPFVAFGKATRNDLGHEVYFLSEEDFKTAPTASYGVNTVDLKPRTVEAPTPEPTPTPVEDAGEQIEVHVTPSDPNKWKETFNTVAAGSYYATKAVDVHDLDTANNNPVLHLPVNGKIPAAGTFTKDAVQYLRSKKSLANDWWYGIPLDAVELEEYDNDGDIFDPNFDPNDIDLGAEFKEYSNREFKIRNSLIVQIAKLDGLFRRIGDWFKKKK